jgi:hypothetical protein
MVHYSASVEQIPIFSHFFLNFDKSNYLQKNVSKAKKMKSLISYQNKWNKRMKNLSEMAEKFLISFQ